VHVTQAEGENNLNVRDLEKGSLSFAAGKAREDKTLDYRESEETAQ
jgi:hypothetical protein